MAEKYYIKFSKDGFAKYTSHLDLLRLFKRAFRKTGIDLKYSEGFNPHPRISFAQPLSLGYAGAEELLEFETDTENDPVKMAEQLNPVMPEGIRIIGCGKLSAGVKSLAGEAESASYTVIIPYHISENIDIILNGYMSQGKILAWKRQKKDKKMVQIDIKNMIRDITASTDGRNIYLDMNLDCGSVSNCSPELVISSFCDFSHFNIPRHTISVKRNKIFFYNNLQI